MIGIPITQDILKYEAKFALNLTTRKCIFYGLGATAVLTSFFLLFKDFSFTFRACASICIGIPLFLWGAVKPFGVNPEKIIGPIIFDNFIAPSVRIKEIHMTVYDDKKKIVKETKKKNRAKISKEYKPIY